QDGRRRRGGLDAEAVQLVDRSREPLEVRRVLAGERDGPDRLLGPGLARRRRPARTGAELPERPEHRVPAAPAQLEEEERVLVEGLAEYIVRGRDMLAGVGPVRARARGLEVLRLGRKEAPAGGRNTRWYAPSAPLTPGPVRGPSFPRTARVTVPGFYPRGP